MSKESRELILGGTIGYFLSNNIFIYSLGVVTGIIIQEKFGSVYKFSQFCVDSVVGVSRDFFKKICGNKIQSVSVELDSDIVPNLVDDNDTKLD